MNVYERMPEPSDLQLLLVALAMLGTWALTYWALARVSRDRVLWCLLLLFGVVAAGVVCVVGCVVAPREVLR